MNNQYNKIFFIILFNINIDYVLYILYIIVRVGHGPR